MIYYDEAGELFCEKLKIKNIINKLQTPLYIYSSAEIIKNYQEYKEAFKEIETLICYAYKANSNLSIINLIKELGGYAEVVSLGELYRAIKVGVDVKKIVFNGNGKTYEELTYAVKKNIFLINIDNEQELSLLNEIAKLHNRKQPIGIRINPYVTTDTHAYVQTSTKDSKFGIDLSKAEQVCKIAANLPNLELVALHFHIGSQILSIEPFIEAIKKIIDLFYKLKNLNINIKYINIGGGLGINYNGGSWLSIKEFGKQVVEFIKPLGVKLMIEPGRSIVGKAGLLVTKVLFTKEKPTHKIIVVDIGMNDFLRPALYGAVHKVAPIEINEKAKKIRAKIVGPLCEESDFIAKDVTLSEVVPGDFIAIFDTGAYCASMASNYNSRPKAAEVLVNGENYFVIREREKIEDIMKEEVLVNLNLFSSG